MVTVKSQIVQFLIYFTRLVRTLSTSYEISLFSCTNNLTEAGRLFSMYKMFTSDGVLYTKHLKEPRIDAQNTAKSDKGFNNPNLNLT